MSSVPADDRSINFTLREMADQYESTLKLMNGALNRISSKYRGVDKHSSIIEDVLAGDRYYLQLSLAKKSLEVDMACAIKDHPVYEWAMGVPGLNRVTICRVVGLIPMSEPQHFYEFSKLQCFAGYAPGKDKLVKGQEATFSPRLKKALFVAIDTVIKSSGVVANKPTRPERLYSEIYVNWRHKYAHRHGVGETGKIWLKKRELFEGIQDYKVFEGEGKSRHPVWPDARQHAAARRKALVYLLAHLWRVWRTNLGWDYRPMFFHEQLHHEFQEDYQLYSSPALAATKKRQRISMPDLNREELDSDHEEFYE